MTSTDRKQSPVRLSISLDGAGRRFGRYHVPFSDNTQPHGHFGPICILQGGDGPTLLLTGGVHGDEYSGPLAIMRLAHELDLSEVSGRLILLPALSASAVKAATRCSPLDSGNMNRAFPGDPGGGCTAMIADWLESEILPHCDAAIDFHAGGSATNYEPLSMINPSPDGLYQRNLDLAKAFGVDLIWLLGELNDKRSVNGAAERAGVPMMACEIGGSGVPDPALTGVAHQGALGVMRHLGMLPGAAPDGTTARLVEAVSPDCTLVAPHAGFFDPHLEICCEVEAGDLAGWIRDPFEIERPPSALHFALSGHLAIRGSCGYVQPGDKLFGLVTDAVAPYGSSRKT